MHDPEDLKVQKYFQNLQIPLKTSVQTSMQNVFAKILQFAPFCFQGSIK